MAEDGLAMLEQQIAEAVNAGDLVQVAELRRVWREAYAVNEAARE